MAEEPQTRKHDQQEKKVDPKALQKRVADLERLVADLQKSIRIPDFLPPTLIGEVTNSDGRWKEKIITATSSANSAGLVVDFGTAGTDGRGCTASADSYALTVPLADAQFFAFEFEDLNHHFFARLPNPAFGVYLTQNGGTNGDDGSTTTAAFPTYTYNVFLDAAKTIQIGTAVAVEWHREMKVAVTAATHGLAQWNGTTLRLLKVDEYWDRDGC